MSKFGQGGQVSLSTYFILINKELDIGVDIHENQQSKAS